MDEFGFGTFGINCETPARNAFDPEYAAGGSSSGAAVATASLKYHVAIAESTGGSIAAPAALNGVVGFTPTYGAVSRYGLIDYANSLDKIGVMARSAEDARKVFDTIRGRGRLRHDVRHRGHYGLAKEEDIRREGTHEAGRTRESGDISRSCSNKLEASGHEIEQDKHRTYWARR